MTVTFPASVAKYIPASVLALFAKFGFHVVIK